MKKTMFMLCLALVSWGVFAQHDHSKMNHMNMQGMQDQKAEMPVVKLEYATTASAILDNYLALKNALVQDNGKNAANAGMDLYNAFQKFDISTRPKDQQDELSDIVEDATENAEHISESGNNIDHQREHFVVLSKDVEDLIMITGADRNIFQIFCPMYNHNEGGMWLSESRDIKNPFLGNKMMKCGSVQKELSVK